MALGNVEAVKAAQGRERKPVTPSPAKETASTRAKTPERVAEPEKPQVDEFAARLRRAIPGISDEAIENLRKEHARFNGK